MQRSLQRVFKHIPQNAPQQGCVTDKRDRDGINLHGAVAGNILAFIKFDDITEDLLAVQYTIVDLQLTFFHGEQHPLGINLIDDPLRSQLYPSTDFVKVNLLVDLRKFGKTADAPDQIKDVVKKGPFQGQAASLVTDVDTRQHSKNIFCITQRFGPDP